MAPANTKPGCNDISAACQPILCESLGQSRDPDGLFVRKPQDEALPARRRCADGTTLMIWWALAALFAWFGLREIYYGFVIKPGYSEPQEIFKGYVVVMLLISAALAYQPTRTLFFERFLEQKARILAETSNVTVHCNTLFDTAVDPMSLAAGYASFETGKIAFQAPWCSVLMDVVRHPERMDRDGIYSVQMFVHEAMHVRGERNEAITECQAIQRYYRAALLLGIPDDIARKSGANYYNIQYKERGKVGGMLAPYYSDECAPGKKLDEHLEDSTWKLGPG